MKTIKLPLEIGESAYLELAFNGVQRAIVQGYSIGTMYDFDEEYEEDESYGNELCIHLGGSGFTRKTPVSEIGKTVFRTRDEAKEFLRKRNKVEGWGK